MRYEHVMGRHGHGVRNENGERFIELCQDHGMVIGGTLFSHKAIHKTTWVSPDGNTKNQIDYLAIRRKFRTSSMDVRVYRGADVASDHELVIGKIRLKLAKIKKQKGRVQRQDVEKLKTKKYMEEFRMELRNRFNILEDDVSDVEESWSKYKKIY